MTIISSRFLKSIGLSLVVLCQAPAVFAQNQSINVKYTASTDPYFQKRDQYFIALLKLAAEKSEYTIQLQPIFLSDQVESRDIINLNKGVIDVHWMHTSKVLESKLIPIRIPLDKGLFGWRIMLMDKSNQHLLRDADNLSDLSRYTFLQGYDWPDTGILLANGLKVETSTSFKGRYKMLQVKRADLFPRSILEAWEELDNQQNHQIVADSHIMLYYPTAVYFFVAYNNNLLHDALNNGLEKSIADGSFDKLFQQYYGEMIKKSEIDKRKIIAIPNPKLPSATPLQRKELWLSPEDFMPLIQSDTQDAPIER
jgi:hypothetical protein